MKRLLFVSVLMGLFAGEAMAARPFGPSTSGGGLAVVCRNAQGSIATAELLDLYEARTKFGFELVASSGSLERDYVAAVDRTYTLQGHPGLAARLRPSIVENLNKFFDLVSMTAPGQRLPPTNDAGLLPVLYPGCNVEQLAIFNDAPQGVRLDSEIWSALNSLSQAALIHHELVYMTERQAFLETTSEGTRATVAYLYARSGPIPVREGLSAAAKSCSSVDPSAWIETHRTPTSVSSYNPMASSMSVDRVMTSQGAATRLQFENFAGRYIVSKATVDFPGLAFETKDGFDRESNGIAAIVITSGVNFQAEIPVRGGQRAGLSVRLIAETGRPLRMVFKKNGQVFSTQIVTGCR